MTPTKDELLALAALLEASNYKITRSDKAKMYTIRNMLRLTDMMLGPMKLEQRKWIYLAMVIMDERQ